METITIIYSTSNSTSTSNGGGNSCTNDGGNSCTNDGGSRAAANDSGNSCTNSSGSISSSSNGGRGSSRRCSRRCRRDTMRLSSPRFFSSLFRTFEPFVTFASYLLERVLCTLLLLLDTALTFTITCSYFR